jgi:alpha-amylase
MWYDSLKALATRLASAGFGAIWIPPATKGGGGLSMGYDIYDHYDFGQFNQKGSIETRFGSRSELDVMLAAYKSVGVELIFDAVMNHVGNGDSQAPYQCGGGLGWIVMNPASGRFPKGPANFHSNNIHCDFNSPYHNKIFFEDLCYFSGGTGDSLISWGNFLLNELGFNGFRLDAVKHIDPLFIAQFSQAFPGVYMVGEHWSGVGEILSYYNQVVSYGGNISMFDYPLRYTLQSMCNNTSGSYDMNGLDNAGLVNAGMSGLNVGTFAENHDLDRIGWDGTVHPGHDPILTDKEMAYAYLIFSEGRPFVFFKDYVDYGLGEKIDTLIWIRQTFIYGGTTKRSQLNPWYVGGSGTQQEQSRDIYVARRNGGNGKPQVYLVLNDNANEWRGVWVNTDYPNQVFRDYTGHGIDKLAAGDGRVDLWAPPRGYAIYVPDTTQFINHPPVMENIPDQVAYTNSFFNYRINVFDADGDSLTYQMNGNPSWLNISQNGLLKGTPAFADTGSSTIIVQVSDPFNETAVDTFSLTVKLNYSPTIEGINDTTIKATIRYEYQATASDPDSDTLNFSLGIAPSFLNIDKLSGLISGTPAPEDTGSFQVRVKVTDNKGAFDSTDYMLTVIPNEDTVIATYGKPTIDGNIFIDEDDWLEEWRIIVDPDDDSFWNPGSPADNELFGIFATWDADSLYLGVDYLLNDDFNTMILYSDAGLAGGITNFNSSSGYNGEYPKNFRFRQEDAIDMFVASYYQDNPSSFMIEGNSSLNVTGETNGLRGDNAEDCEVAIAWNTIYNLGAGLIPPNVELKFVAVVAGGYNYGAGDSAPDNPDVNGDAGPDSLIFLVSIFPDTDGNGVPDPTIILEIDTEKEQDFIPDNFMLYQNFPNPFNPATTIQFDIAEAGFIELKVYDVLGNEIAVLIEDLRPAGRYNLTFDASSLPSGIYFCRLKTNRFTAVKKMIMLK